MIILYTNICWLHMLPVPCLLQMQSSLQPHQPWLCTKASPMQRKPCSAPKLVGTMPSRPYLPTVAFAFCRSF